MIKFTLNSKKALQCLLWVLKKKPGIDKYNIMKVMFEADRYHLNKYGRPIYGEKYVAMKHGTVPSFMKDLLNIDQNMPFYKCSLNGYKANSVPDYDVFSESDIEALEHGFEEYGNLSFYAVEKKNHEHRAWKDHEHEFKTNACKRIDIDYAKIIDNPEVLKDLEELGSLTENMVF